MSKKLKFGERCLVEGVYFPGDNGSSGKVVVIGERCFPVLAGTVGLTVSNHLIHQHPDLKASYLLGKDAGMKMNPLTDCPVAFMPGQLGTGRR